MQWKIPLAGVDFDRHEHEAVSKVLTGKWLSMGEETQAFEREFAAYIGTRHAIAVGNCTQALHLAYRALGVGSEDEVLLPSLTFVAMVNTILQTGANPVFADITSRSNLNISIDDLRKKITPKTKVLSVLHYGGYPADIEGIRALAREYSLAIVEDVAHAVGASRRGEKCGSMGDVGCFSFFSNKNMTTGEGGMITTNSDELAEKMRLYRSHGMTSLSWDRHQGHAFSYDVVEAGYNYRIDEIRSAIGRVQLGKLDRANAYRKILVERYFQELGSLDQITVPFLNRSWHDEDIHASYHIFPILLNDASRKSRLADALKDQGIQTSMHYPPIHQFTYFQKRFPIRLSVTEEVASGLITLPLHTAMTVDQVDWIVSVIKQFLKS